MLVQIRTMNWNFWMRISKRNILNKKFWLLHSKSISRKRFNVFICGQFDFIHFCTYVFHSEYLSHFEILNYSRYIYLQWHCTIILCTIVYFERCDTECRIFDCDFSDLTDTWINKENLKLKRKKSCNPDVKNSQ